MKLSDWTVVTYENEENSKSHYLYGPIEEFIENEEDRNNINIVPQEEWSIENMMEITSNLLEDINHHKTEAAPRFIVGTMISVGISDDDIKSFMREYMEQIYNRYGY